MSFGTLGGWEWIIILLIVIVLFGLGRVPKAMSDLGKSLKEFRTALRDDNEG